jgi:hypothetical protein
MDFQQVRKVVHPSAWLWFPEIQQPEPWLIPFLEIIDTISVGKDGFCNQHIVLMARLSPKPAPTNIGSLLIKKGITHILYQPQHRLRFNF